MKEPTSLNERKDFFISYTSADKGWAEWIAWQLEDNHKQVIIQAWDFRPGSNFVAEMDKATRIAERTIAVLSQRYFQSEYTLVEWIPALKNDLKGEQSKLLPIRVENFKVEGLLGSINYIDLFDLDEQEARKRLLEGIDSRRTKPASVPFPAGSAAKHVHKVVQNQPTFPGNTPPRWNVSHARLIQQIENALKKQDYSEAYHASKMIVQNYQKDLDAREVAWLVFMQALAYLQGNLPRDLQPSTVQSASALIHEALREHPLRSYIAILTAIEDDFAQTGLRRKGVDVKQLERETYKTSVSEEDQEVLHLLAAVQPKLYRYVQKFF